jgi:hypothetical protein
MNGDCQFQSMMAVGVNAFQISMHCSFRNRITCWAVLNGSHMVVGKKARDRLLSCNVWITK